MTETTDDSPITVYISIGNSDDRLTQLDWCRFVGEVDRAVDRSAQFEGATVHGRWHSLPTEPWQNACRGRLSRDEAARLGAVLTNQAGRPR